MKLRMDFCRPGSSLECSLSRLGHGEVLLGLRSLAGEGFGDEGVDEHGILSDEVISSDFLTRSETGVAPGGRGSVPGVPGQSLVHGGGGGDVQGLPGG